MKRINFDHLACAPILPEAKEAMLPYLSEDIGNPLSRHLFGEKPKEAIEEARANVAGLINANSEEEIVFTSCGSESNNLAIKGIAQAYVKNGRHIIASPIEHHSALHPLKGLEKQGYEVSWLKVDREGRVDPGEVARLIRKDTILVTVTSASNEIGTLEPIGDIGKIAREKGVVFHTDAVACVGNIYIDVREFNIDLLSLAGNTFYGPLGSGALYIRKGVRVAPLIEGGIQEKGLRAGTHNVAGIVGMGVAAKEARENLPSEPVRLRSGFVPSVVEGRREHLLHLRERLIGGVLANIPDSFLTGDRTNRLPNHASFCIKFIEGESISLHLNFLGIAATSGSTCSSEALKVSHVLDAIGVNPVWAQGSIIFTLGIDNEAEDIELLIKELPPIVDRLRQMSPLSSSEDIEKFKKEGGVEWHGS